MDIGLFGNFDDDGQMSMFAFEEPEFDMESELAAGTAALEKEREEKESDAGKNEKAAVEERSAATKKMVEPASNIRIQRCSTCGKLLFVKEESGGYTSFCNNCEIGYFQKA